MAGDYARELDVISRAAQLCAVLTDRLQKASLNADNSIQKSDFSPVTIGDFAAQALLTSAVHGVFPDDKFLAEESADDLRQNAALLEQVWQLIEGHRESFHASSPPLKTPASKDEVLRLLDAGGKNQVSNTGRLWVFDPIDGTATFIRGQQYALNCAFLVDGQEQIGLIACPNLALDSTTASEDVVDRDGLGLQIFAVRGHGAFVRPMRVLAGPLAEATPLGRHGDKATLNNLTWSDCSTYTSTILTLHQQVAAKLGTSWPGVDLHSSLMKYAALGLGRCHITLRVFKYTSWRSNMWDHAGGVLIFEEAGGRVTDLDGKSIDFTTGRKMSANYGLVCAPSSVHAEILATVREVMAAYGPIPVRR